MNKLDQKTKMLLDSIKYIKDVEIMVYPYSAVAIGDDIFLQGDDADNFVKDARALYEEYGTITMDDAYKAIALPWF